MTKKELVDLIKKEFTRDNGVIDLVELDFGEVEVRLTRLKAGSIINSYQKASNTISNNHQIARFINNKDQVKTGKGKQKTL